MTGMSLNEFIEKVYEGFELEFEWSGMTYFIQGTGQNGKYSLTVDYWSRTDGLEPHHGYLWEYECENLDERLKAFEEAKIFDGKTIYEIEADIHVLWS